MATKDEFKTEREAYFANATWKQKLFYFWEYYKIHTIVVLLIVIAVSSFIYHRVTDPEIILNGFFLNAYNIESEISAADLGQEFLELQEIDTAEYDVNFNQNLFLTGDDTTDYEASQAVWVQCGAGTVDFMISPLEHLMDFAYQEYYIDLTSVLTKEQIAKYEPYFLYVDGAVIEEMAAAPPDSPMDDIELPDPAKPEEMEEPVPVFIDMTQCQKTTDIYGDVDSLVFSVLVNAPNSDLTIKFLDYLMK